MTVHRFRYPLLPRVGIPIVMSVLLALATAIPALATGGSTTPTYKAVVSPTSAAAGTSATSTITLTQLVNSTERKLGSVRITPPAGLTLTGASAARGTTNLPVVIAGGSVTVNDIDLKYSGKTATVTLQTTIACGIAGSKTWTVVAHSTSSFTSSYAKVLVRHSSSQLTTTVSACSLAFPAGGQPSATGLGETITNAPGDPSGPPVAVQLRDGNGAPANQAGVGISLAIAPGTGTAGATLGGSISAPTGATGLASFAPTIDLIGHDYQLVATAGAGISPATSTDFDVDEVVEACAGACSGTAELGDTVATVSATSNGGLLTMSLGLDSPATVDCNDAVNGFYVGTSEVLTFNVTPATGRTTVVMSVDGTKPFWQYEVCFSSPGSSFVNKLGAPIAAGQPGILPWCANIFKPSGGPCVVLKWPDFHGNVFVKFSVPQGDPRGRI
jgi:hypothetical protein